MCLPEDVIDLQYPDRQRPRPFKDQWLLYVPPGLTLFNSAFRSLSVCMCFVWISEQTAIISLYSPK